MKEERFQAILQGLDDVRRWLAGEDVPGMSMHFVPGGDVAAIRKRTGLSQDAFARQMKVPLATLRDWESGCRCPVGPARVLLALLAMDAAIIQRTLSQAA